MVYRCPYCKQELGADPPTQCPACSRVMLTPRMRLPGSRILRKRRIENIWRECEQQKAELTVPAPQLLRNPRLTFIVILVLALLGGGIYRAADSVQKKAQSEVPHQRALRHVDVLAEALGRFHHHVGVFPTAQQGLAALARPPQPLPPGWNGPYINQLRNDPWDTPYVYEPPADGVLPVLLSCGADKLRGTADDIMADPTRFDPGTEWTNEWVSAEERLPGVRILRKLPDSSQ